MGKLAGYVERSGEPPASIRPGCKADTKRDSWKGHEYDDQSSAPSIASF